jgi:inositol phosphorylceramide mannosyltransferase catalytic subunit
LIPRTIHTIWLGGHPPAELQRFVETWKQHHPSWQHRHWTDPADVVIRNRALIEKAEQYVPRQSMGQFVSDVMRYEILERHGGVYIDCDMECRTSFDLLLAGRECFAGWEVQGQWIGNAILAASPAALFVQRLIEMLPWSVDANRGKRPNVSTGPQFLTKQYRGHEDELYVYPQSFFYPAPWSSYERSTEEWPNAMAVHHWWNQRTKTGVGL